MTKPVTTTTLGEAFDKLTEEVKEVRRLKAAGEWKRAITGVKLLDDAIGGLLPKVTILTGETKVGKTTFAMNCALANAKAGITPVIWSSEMEDTELAGLGASIVAQIPRVRWRDYDASDDDITLAKVTLEDTGLANAIILRSRQPRGIVEYMKENPPQLLIVDYLQYLAMIIRGDMKTAIDDITRVLHEVSTDLRIPILLLSAENAEGRVFSSRLAGYTAIATIKLSKPTAKEAASYSAYPGDPVFVSVPSARHGRPVDAVVFIDRTTGRIVEEAKVIDENLDEIMEAANDEIPF